MVATICLAVGCAFRETAVVPDVAGDSVYSAYDELHRAGFAVRINEPFDATPSHTADVRHQSPAGGAEAPKGTPISLDVMPGPHGRLPPGPPPLRMPSLIGKSLADAAAILTELRLSWTADLLRPLPPSTEPTLLHNYEVRSQEPRPGARFTQSTVRKTAEGIVTKTTPVWLSAALRRK